MDIFTLRLFQASTPILIDFQTAHLLIYHIHACIKNPSFIESKKSCFFEHEEIRKPLQLPERLSLLKAQK